MTPIFIFDNKIYHKAWQFNRPGTTILAKIQSYFYPAALSRDLLRLNHAQTRLYQELKQNPSEKRERFIKVLHQAGDRGYFSLKYHLFHINNELKNENKRTYLSLLIVSIANFFLKLLGRSPLVVPMHACISSQQWKEVLKPIKKEAFQLTEKEHASFSIQVIDSPLPDSFTEENFAKLEHRLKSHLSFELGSCVFEISHKKHKSGFCLRLSFPDVKNAIKTERCAAKILEKTRNVTKKKHLWTLMKVKHLWHKKDIRAKTSQPIELKFDSEYSILRKREAPFKFILIKNK